MQSNLIVTTARHPTPEMASIARRAAEELGGRIVPKTGHTTIRKIQSQFHTRLVLSIGQRMTLFVDDQEIFFHPSMSVVRLKRILTGEADTLLVKSRVQPGDSILDCTLGMGADAIVFAHAAGVQGRVVGIEQSELLAFLVKEGLKRWQSDMRQLEEAMRRVEVVAMDHLSFMKRQPDRSFDVVYFDPMFRHTVKESVNFDPVRFLSVDHPLTHEAIGEARRIARKTVVLKERLSGGEFERLGFPPPDSRSSSFTYSVIHMQEEHTH
jgi:predicted methyltransferase